MATPLAALLNVKEKTRLRASPNPTLEHFYLSIGKQPKQVRAEPGLWSGRGERAAEGSQGSRQVLTNARQCPVPGLTRMVYTTSRPRWSSWPGRPGSLAAR